MSFDTNPADDDPHGECRQADYRDCIELAGQICESIEKADGSWAYEGDDLPGQIIPHLQPVIGEIQRLQARVRELEASLVKEGPLNSERWTLDELLAELEKWKRVASGQTCVSFENLCYGASSLWHQTHRENFRKVDRKPEELSRWVLEHAKCVMEDFPAQVLEILQNLEAANARLRDENERLRQACDIFEKNSENAAELFDQNYRLRDALQSMVSEYESTVDSLDSAAVRHARKVLSSPPEVARLRGDA